MSVWCIFSLFEFSFILFLSQKIVILSSLMLSPSLSLCLLKTTIDCFIYLSFECLVFCGQHVHLFLFHTNTLNSHLLKSFGMKKVGIRSADDHFLLYFLEFEVSSAQSNAIILLMVFQCKYYTLMMKRRGEKRKTGKM